ncbi:MAG: hypothetical protein ACRD2Q_12255 [Terriglobales bacterium]
MVGIKISCEDKIQVTALGMVVVAAESRGQLGKAAQVQGELNPQRLAYQPLDVIHDARTSIRVGAYGEEY